MFEDWAECSVSAARRIEFSASLPPLLSNMNYDIVMLLRV